MGGRSATSGVATFGHKSGTRLLPNQYKDAVSAQANFILRELETSPALQNIIRRSFKYGVAQVTLTIQGSGFKATQSFVDALDTYTDDFQARLREAKREKKTSQTWSTYDVARAREQALQQAINELEKAKKKHK